MNIAGFHRRFVEEAPDGLLAVDRDGVIRFWNAGCERIFGYLAAETIGASLDIIIPERLRARHWQGFAETMRTGVTRYGAGELLSVPTLRCGRHAAIRAVAGGCRPGRCRRRPDRTDTKGFGGTM